MAVAEGDSPEEKSVIASCAPASADSETGDVCRSHHHGGLVPAIYVFHQQRSLLDRWVITETIR